MSLDSAINAIPLMLTIWAAVTACFVAILTYRGQLTRYEQERLFLSSFDSSSRPGETLSGVVTARLRTGSASV